MSRKLYPNVDFYSGIIYQAMGFPVDMFPVLFAIPRVAGWLAQWQEMLDGPGAEDRPAPPGLHRGRQAALRAHRGAGEGEPGSGNRNGVAPRSESPAVRLRGSRRRPTEKAGPRSLPRPAFSVVGFSYGVRRLIILGKGMTSRMWETPHIQATVRSTPRPKPECGKVP